METSGIHIFLCLESGNLVPVAKFKRSVLSYAVQRVLATNAMSVIPNIVAVDGLSPTTTELRLLRLAETVGPVQVIWLSSLLDQLQRILYTSYILLASYGFVCLCYDIAFVDFHIF